MRILLFIGIWFCFSATLKSQENAHLITDIVYLKDGSRVVGKIVEWKMGEYLLLKNANGFDLHIQQRFIKKVVQKEEESNGRLEEKVNPFDKKGLYGKIRTASLTGNKIDGGLGLGWGSQVLLGYRLNPHVGLGLSMGMEKMSINSDEDIFTYPLMLEWEGQWKQSAVLPSLHLGIGYGFSFQQTPTILGYRQITDAQGGLAYQAFLGFRLSDQCRLNAGIRFQHKKLTWNNIWSDLPYENIDDVVNKRFLLGIEYIW